MDILNNLSSFPHIYSSTSHLLPIFTTYLISYPFSLHISSLTHFLHISQLHTHFHAQLPLSTSLIYYFLLYISLHLSSTIFTICFSTSLIYHFYYIFFSISQPQKEKHYPSFLYRRIILNPFLLSTYVFIYLGSMSYHMSSHGD